MTDMDSADALVGAAPIEVLRWAVARFPRVGFSTGFGPEGCVLIDLIGRHALAIDVFTLDTGLLFDETRALWRALEARYRITIRAVSPARTVDEQAQDHGDALWSRDPDACCALRKVAPLALEAQHTDAWISAIRRDQTRDRSDARVVERDARFGVAKINPLVAWSSDDVWRHLREHDVPTNPLHDRGYPSIGCAPCTSPVADGEDPRAGRWRGRAKTECGLHQRATTSSSPALIAAARLTRTATNQDR